MERQKSSAKIFIYALLIILLLINVANIITASSHTIFKLEIMAFVVMLLFAFIGLLGYAKSWGEPILFFFFLGYLLNTVVAWYFLNWISVPFTLIAVLGFVISLPQSSNRVPAIREEPHSQVFTPLEKKEESSIKKEQSAKAEIKVETSYTLGKYLASTHSNIYHQPTCDWAKRIKKDRRTWFPNKEKAWEQGYKAHSCVK